MADLASDQILEAELMIEHLYLVELVGINGDFIGIEKFLAKETAMRFIDDYSDSSSYCNLFEARQVDY